MKVFDITIHALVDSNGAISFEVYAPKDMTKKGMQNILLAAAVNQGARKKDFRRVLECIVTEEAGLPKSAKYWAETKAFDD